MKHITLHIEELGCEADFEFYYQVNPDPLAAFTAADQLRMPANYRFVQNASSTSENPAVFMGFWRWDHGNTDKSDPYLPESGNI